jgi:cell division protein ZapA
VKIEIYHQTYNLQAEENEEYLNELAAYVDAKMRAVAKSTQTVDTVRIAVLAALNIADELHSQPAAGASARASAAQNAEAIREAREEARAEAREEAVRETTERLMAEREMERRAQMDKTASLRRQVEDCVKIVDKVMAASGSAA